MDHHKVNLENVARVVMALGLNGFKNLSNQMPACSVKYAGLTLGEAEAIFNVLGEVNMKRILAGEVTIEIKELIRRLADKNGRMIRFAVMKSAIKDSKTSFKFVQPEINYVERHKRLIRFFPGFTFLSVEEFQKRSEALLEQLRNDDFLSNLLKGVWLPVCYPHFKISDYGADLKNLFLKAVGDSYENQFPDRKFRNYRESEMKRKVVIAEESHMRFLAKMAEDSMVGLQFFPLQGFSVHADRELMPMLPQSVHLSGPIDIATAMTAYPDVLAYDSNTPIYDCAAVSWRSDDFKIPSWDYELNIRESVKYSLYFGVEDDGLKFAASGNLDFANDNSSGGLVYLG